MSNLNNQQIILNFNLYLSQNKASNSIRSCNSAINLISHLDFTNCTSQDLLKWRQEYSQKVAKTTLEQRITLLHGFFLYLTKSNVRQDNPMNLIEKPKKSVGVQKKYDLISEDVYTQIFNDPTIHITDKLAIKFGYYAGLRISEVCNITVENIDLKNEVLTISESKGLKTRYIPIPQPLKIAIAEYIDMFNITNGNLLRKRDNQKISPQSMNRRFNKIKKVYKFDATFHGNRHGYATKLLDNNVSISNVQEMLGHSSIQTTINNYKHSNIENAKAQIAKVFV